MKGAKHPRVARGHMHEVQRIVRILSHSSPRRIILFGSLARGMPTRESDIDLCVLVDSYGGRPQYRIKQDLYKLLASHRYDFPVDVDVWVYSVQDFEDRLAQGDVFLCGMAAGRVVYEQR